MKKKLVLLTLCICLGAMAACGSKEEADAPGAETSVESAGSEEPSESTENTGETAAEKEIDTRDISGKDESVRISIDVSGGYLVSSSNNLLVICDSEYNHKVNVQSGAVSSWDLLDRLWDDIETGERFEYPYKKFQSDMACSYSFLVSDETMVAFQGETFEDIENVLDRIEEMTVVKSDDSSQESDSSQENASSQENTSSQESEAAGDNTEELFDHLITSEEVIFTWDSQAEEVFQQHDERFSVLTKEGESIIIGRVYNISYYEKLQELHADDLETGEIGGYEYIRFVVNIEPGHYYILKLSENTSLEFIGYDFESIEDVLSKLSFTIK